MTTSKGNATPLVSMIIPVYNSVAYLPETLDSMLEQGLAEDELEVITIDDGSNDGSEAMLDEYANKYPNFRVIHQKNSGGPAAPCNVGLEAARGRYFFVLGSDDVMTSGALRDLAVVAEREGSDIVLGRLGSIGGRRTPGLVFRETIYDADLVESHAFNTLSAIKLFRKDLLHKTGARFPTTMRIGEDQPFVATLYLAASKVSICADRDYVLIRTRDDGSNITATRRTANEYMDLLKLLVPAIVDGTSPGRVRDGLMRRPFRNTLTKILKPSFLKESRECQEILLKDIREVIAPVYNGASASHLEPLPRTKVEVALDGNLEVLRDLMAWEGSGASRKIVHDGAKFAYKFPAKLAERVGEGRTYSPAVKGVTTLTDIDCTGGFVRVDFSASVVGCDTFASETLFRLRNRETGDIIDYPSDIFPGLVSESRSGRGFRVGADLSECMLGVWDAYVVQRFGDDEVIARFGAEKDERFVADPVYLLADTEESNVLGKLYFTRGAQNLSIDIGFTLTINELPEASSRGVIAMHGKFELAILRVQSAAPFEVFMSSGGTEHLAAFAHVEMGGGLIAVAIPKGFRNGTSRRCLVVRSGDGEREVHLQSSVSGCIEAPEYRSSGQMLVDGGVTVGTLQNALRVLGSVGERSIRRTCRMTVQLGRRLSKRRGREGS